MFQICSKNLFLTYPECELTKEALYTLLWEKFNPLNLCVAHEKHQNGNSHLHAFVGLETQFRTRDPRFADFAGYHGNYQGCRSAKSVVKYCTKEDDYKANFDVETVIAKNTSKKTILGKRLLEGEDLCEIVKENPELVFGFKKLKEDIDCLQECMLYKSIELEIPGEVPNNWNKTFLVDTDVKKCHYWFYSTGPNKGKTTGVILPLIRNYHASLYTPSALYHNIRRETKVICLDEIRKGSIKYEILNSMCDGTHQFRVFMRGNICLSEKPLLVVCSNYSIIDVFPFKSELVYARFIEVDVSNF